MDARELRIGNYIYDNEVGCKGEFRVCAGDIKTIDDDQKEFDYSALPLTEEWLLKFGFSQVLNSEYYDSNEYGNCEQIRIDTSQTEDNLLIKQSNSEERSDDVILVDNGIKYVHQLQNLYFALTGKELELNND